MFFVNRQKKVEELLTQYCDQVSACVRDCTGAIKAYSENPDRSRLHEDYLAIHRIESKADDIRNDIEVMMYSKSIFPESRGDILGLIETVDKVPNQAEKIIQTVLTHHITIPSQFTSYILQLLESGHKCVESLVDGMRKLFVDFTAATLVLGKVDELESESDQIQVQLYEQIFSSQLDGFEKIVLRDLVEAIASLSDRAENAGDRIRIIVAKRKF